MSFKNKVVIVTGASSGLGEAIAIKFAEEGANVVIVGRNEAKLQQVKEKCEKFGNKQLSVKADVSNEDDAKRIIRDTIDTFSKIDILVNNAGILRLAAVMSENILQVYDEVMKTNLRAVIHLTHLAAPYLAESKGNIVNVSSIASKKPVIDSTFTSYAISKAALDHFTRCVALELAPKGIRVNVVNPGPFKTEVMVNAGFQHDASETFWQNVDNYTALGKIGDNEEIGDLVMYLASDKARSITGSSFVCDNGMLLK